MKNEENELADFLLEHYEPYRHWDPMLFMGWLGWHAHQGFITRVHHDHKKLVGVGILRPIMKAEDGDDFFATDPEGSILFIDLVISLHPMALKAIGIGVLKRFGMRNKVAWKRSPFYETEVHSAARLRRVLFRQRKAVYGIL